jgi:GNAT superfamily N-acetyltransferase
VLCLLVRLNVIRLGLEILSSMNAAHLPSVSPVSCVSEPGLRYGRRGAAVSVTGGAAGMSLRFWFSRTEVLRMEARWRGFGVRESSANGRAGALAVRHRELLVTTNWRDVDVAELRALLTGTSQNCDQFPKLDPDGSVSEVCPVKLKRAVQHSFIVVAMYVRGELEEDYFPDRPEDDTPPRLKRTLVAFGRATSDRALTASIHDLAVAPALQGQGIGRRLMHRIVREICRYGISDISVMANRETRPFFRACGFGSDVLGSTAMMYTAAEDCSDAESSMLLVPPPLQESWTLDAAEARRKEVVKNVSSA